jgi:hypothetical protein
MRVWYPPAADAEARSDVAAAVVMATRWVTLPWKYDLGEYLSYEEIRHSVGTGLDELRSNPVRHKGEFNVGGFLFVKLWYFL